MKQLVTILTSVVFCVLVTGCVGEAEDPDGRLGVATTITQLSTNGTIDLELFSDSLPCVQFDTSQCWEEDHDS